MNIKTKSNSQQPCNGNIAIDTKALVELFELLLEWDIEDAKKKEEQGEEVSKKIQAKGC